MKRLMRVMIVLSILSPAASYAWYVAGANMPASVAEVLIVR